MKPELLIDSTIAIRGSVKF